MPAFRSILSRLIVLHVIAVAITSVAISAALSWLLERTADSIHNEAMRKQAETIGNHLKVDADGRLTLQLPPELQGLYSQPYDRYVYAVLDPLGNVLLASNGSRTAIFPKFNADYVSFKSERRDEHFISGVNLPKTVGAQSYVIQAAEDLSNRDALTDDITASFFFEVGWITLPILLLLLLIDIAIFRRALLPLQLASDTARQITPSRTDIRLPTQDVPDEMRPLLLAVNHAFERLDKGFQAQRDFTADSAHELRTPLSILKTRIDLIKDSDLSEELRRDIDGMTRIVGQLLEIAEVETASLEPSDRADLHALTMDVVCYVAPMAIAQNKSVALTGTSNPVFVRGNTEMIKRAVLNLADNAIKHTREKSPVQFKVNELGTIEVRDHGPGISQPEKELIFQRFWRRDRSRPGSTGLGLSIVSRIAELHGARVTVADAAGGGTRFSIAFQLAVDAVDRPPLSGPVAMLV